MEREKVKEIKKALQETIDGKLSTEYLTVCEISCCPRLDIDKLFADILTLINELESENEKIKHISLNEEITVGEYLRGMQRLKDRVAELEEGIAKSMLGCEFLPECTNDTLKQFAERLKDYFEDMLVDEFGDIAVDVKYLTINIDEFEEYIDELLKEYEK